jgi:hypothetical protein
MKVRFAVSALLGAALAIGAIGSANAQLIVGTMPVSLGVSSATPANALLNSLPVLNLGSAAKLGAATGDYLTAGIPDFAPFTPSATLDLSTIATSTFPLASGTYGVFTATSGAFVSAPTANFANVLLLGDFVPNTTAFPGKISTPSSLNLTITRNETTSGVSYNIASVLASPPATVPEPGTYAFAATSGIGALVMLRRRKKA